ncbi:glycosyltransferase, partial [Mediterraneibacter sp. 210702-DFI.5.30]|nr:glycosyltransferase [Mediterraneibacter sp. 210702-DFI.5.30]
VAYGIPRSKITYIPNFVDDAKFHPVDELEKRRLKTKWGIAQQRFVVVGSGQIQERKGVFDFIQLAEQNPDVQFIW